VRYVGGYGFRHSPKKSVLQSFSLEKLAVRKLFLYSRRSFSPNINTIELLLLKIQQFEFTVGFPHREAEQKSETADASCIFSSSRRLFISTHN